MKKKVLSTMLALFAIATTARAQVEINATNFPDEKFRAYVKDNFDTNKNNFLSEEEIAKVTKIDVNGKDIYNLIGIERFTALTELRCHNNGLTSLDLSKNKKLTYLRCYRNKIKGTEMKMLVASLPTVTGGQFYVINLDSNEQNEIVVPAVNNAKDKGWKVLGYSGGNNGEWKEYAGSGIRIDATNFHDENFCKVVADKAIDKDEDGYLSNEEIAAVEIISVRSKEMGSLKGIEYFTALTELYCDGNQLTSLDISKNTALKTLYCDQNQLTSLDVSNNTKLTYLTCGQNQLTKLDVTKHTALEQLYCYQNQLTSLDVTKNTALKELICDGNQLTELDVTRNTALTRFECYENQLTALDVSKNTKLTKLSCYVNQIKGDKMQKLVDDLPTVSSGDFYVIYTKGSNEGNVITKPQVDIAKNKNWTVHNLWNGEYAGSVVITATANPAEGGTVTGAGTYEAGKTVTLKATPNEGYKFKQWTYVYKGKKYTDTENPFVLPNNTADWTLTAYFEKDETTAINTVENGKMTNDNYYSIDGVKLNGEPTKKGIYIKNGKKVVK